MDRETMRLAILSAAGEWREDDKKRIRPAKSIPANLKGRTFRLKPPEGGEASKEGEEAGGERKSHGNTRLPYGLCKKYGIDVPPGTTPYEAWELLKGKGVNPREEYRKLKERGERAQEKAKREAEERAKREAEERARKEAEEKARREAKERARKEAEEKARREAEERARREAEEKAKREAEEKAKREAEEKARKEAEEKARREAEEESPAGAWPAPERVKPKRFGSAREATAYLKGRCNGRITESWEKGVCASAKKKIAGTVAALEERYGALVYNYGWPVKFEDGKGPKPGSVAAASCDPGRLVLTTGLSFHSPYFSSEAGLAYSRRLVRDARGKKGDYFYMPSAEGMEVAYLAAHEYGHCVEYNIMRDMGISGKDAFNDASEQIKDEILQIAREIEPGRDPGKPIAEGGCISGYGSDSPREFFAECFANSVCGEPNVLGRAMAIYLDRRGYGRGAEKKDTE